MTFSSIRTVFADMDSNLIICAQWFLLLVLFRYTGASLQLAPRAYDARNLCWDRLAVEQWTMMGRMCHDAMRAAVIDGWRQIDDNRK